MFHLHSLFTQNEKIHYAKLVESFSIIRVIYSEGSRGYQVKIVRLSECSLFSNSANSSSQVNNPANLNSSIGSNSPNTLLNKEQGSQPEQERTLFEELRQKIFNRRDFG